MDAAILKLAKALDEKYQRDYALYLEECDSYRRDGYRPAYCEHGTSQWTDYDNICGPCEEGYTMSDGLFRMGYAISEAKHRYAKGQEIISWLSKAHDLRMRDFVDLEKVLEEYQRIMTVK